MERLREKMVRVFRSVLSELQMRQKALYNVQRAVQSLIINSPSPKRGNASPINAVTDLKLLIPINTFIQLRSDSPVSVNQLN